MDAIMSGGEYNMSHWSGGELKASHDNVADSHEARRFLNSDFRTRDFFRYNRDDSDTTTNIARSSQFERIASAAATISTQRVKLLGILLAAASPTLCGGSPVLRPIWATEALHRAHSMVRLVAHLEQRAPRHCQPREPLDFETKLAVELASIFDSLVIGRDVEPRACSLPVRDAARNLVELFGPGVGRLTLTTSVERLSLPAFQHRALTLMASELIINCLLHAFVDRPTGRMTLQVDQLNRGMARLVVTDDGRGLCGTASHRPAPCSVISDLADLLQSELTYRQAVGGGTIAEIDIPLQ
jgi:two-component sensor histidine kinase